MSPLIFSKTVKFIVFEKDAFGTLFRPKQSIGLQYHEASLLYNIPSPGPQELERRFGKEAKVMDLQYPNFGKDSIGCREWWKFLILQTFGEKSSHSTQFKEMQEYLYNAFENDVERLYIFPEVIPTLTKLNEKNIDLHVLSNMDSRLSNMMKNLNLAQYFKTINTSYALNSTKPNPIIYTRLLENLGMEGKDGKVNGIFIGDDIQKDVLSPLSSGFRAGFLLQRSNMKNSSPLNTNLDENVDERNGVYHIENLMEIFKCIK